MFGQSNKSRTDQAAPEADFEPVLVAPHRTFFLVPGSHYDGAWTWTTTDNAAVVGTGVQDPAHNFAFEVHQYLDADGSGTHPGVVRPRSASSG
jgi:hypothetical protein